MATLTLKHCEPVIIWGPQSAQSETLHLSVGGSAGDGTVQVSGGAGQQPVPGNVDTGDTDDVVISACTLIVLHYFKTPRGPDEISVDYTISP